MQGTSPGRLRPGGAALLLLIAGFALGAPPLGASPGELPLPTFDPSGARDAILRSADSLIGTPYVYGGQTRQGLDCSGYVFLVFREAMGKTIPRTVYDQGRWVQIIPRKELRPGDLVFFDLDKKSAGAADHVGLYVGDDYFLHAASEGPKTGVVRNKLSESSWNSRFLFAGRAVSASALSGLALDWGFGADFDSSILSATGFDGFIFRGAGARLAATLPLGRNFSLGLEAGAHWDNLLGVYRLPMELVIGQNEGFAVFAGPALTLGSPILPAAAGGTNRYYESADGWLATAGIRWTPFLLRSGATSAGLFTELRYDRYLPAAGQSADVDADRRASFSLEIGLRIRSVHY